MRLSASAEEGLDQCVIKEQRWTRKWTSNKAHQQTTFKAALSISLEFSLRRFLYLFLKCAKWMIKGQGRAIVYTWFPSKNGLFSPKCVKGFESRHWIIMPFLLPSYWFVKSNRIKKFMHFFLSLKTWWNKFFKIYIFTNCKHIIFPF